MVVSLANLRALLAAEVPPGRADEDGVRRQWWAALATLQEDLLAPGPKAEHGLWLAAPLPALYEPRLLRRLRSAQDRIGEHRDNLLADHWVQLNVRALGRPLAARLVDGLARQEQDLRRQSAARAARVLVAWRQWRDATRRVRKAASPGRR